MNNGDMAINGIIEKAGDIMVKDGGLTKREYFAGLAMQGLCSNKGYITEDWKKIIVKESVTIADALLKELDK